MKWQLHLRPALTSKLAQALDFRGIVVPSVAVETAALNCVFEMLCMKASGSLEMSDM